MFERFACRQSLVAGTGDRRSHRRSRLPLIASGGGEAARQAKHLIDQTIRSSGGGGKLLIELLAAADEPTMYKDLWQAYLRLRRKHSDATNEQEFDINCLVMPSMIEFDVPPPSIAAAKSPPQQCPCASLHTSPCTYSGPHEGE